MGTVQMTSAHGACIRALVFFLVREQMLTFVGSNAETNVAHTENNCLTTFEVPFEVPQISSNTVSTIKTIVFNQFEVLRLGAL